MRKKIRKQHPEPPLWWELDSDCCWWCKNKNNCSDCRVLKKVAAEQKEKRLRGKYANR